MTQSLHNPYDVKDSIQNYNIDVLENDTVYTQAMALAQAIQDLYPYVKDRGTRWDAYYDQVERASSSVAANYAQGFAKLKGHTESDYLVSRGELHELYAYLCLMPQPFKDLLPACKQLIKALDKAIYDLPPKPANSRW